MNTYLFVLHTIDPDYIDGACYPEVIRDEYESDPDTYELGSPLHNSTWQGEGKLMGNALKKDIPAEFRASMVIPVDSYLYLANIKRSIVSFTYLGKALRDKIITALQNNVRETVDGLNTDSEVLLCTSRRVNIEQINLHYVDPATGNLVHSGICVEVSGTDMLVTKDWSHL